MTNSHFTASTPTPDDPHVDHCYLATLVRPIRGGKDRIIDTAYIRAEHDPHATARERFGNPGPRYKVRVRPVTARDLGMTRIPA